MSIQGVVTPPSHNDVHLSSTFGTLNELLIRRSFHATIGSVSLLSPLPCLVCDSWKDYWFVVLDVARVELQPSPLVIWLHCLLPRISFHGHALVGLSPCIRDIALMLAVFGCALNSLINHIWSCTCCCTIVRRSPYVAM